MLPIVVVACALLISCGNGGKGNGSGKDSTAHDRTGSSSEMLVAYQHDGIRLMTLPGEKSLRLTDGYDPEIAPYGKAVAYTLYDKNGSRFIAVYDLDAGSSMVFKDVPGRNDFGPRWSPDGKRILFNHFTGRAWLPAYTGADGKGFTVVGEKYSGGISSGLHAPCWGPEGETIVCHNLDTLFLFSLSGRLVWKRAFHNIMKGYADSVSVSSASRLEMHPDGQTLLIGLESSDGPIGVAYTYNFENGAVARIGPRDFHIVDPSWLPGGKGIIFTGCPLSMSIKKRLMNFEDVNTRIFKTGSHTAAEQLANEGLSPTCAAVPAM
jgi:Tol biopolymer transport system component